MRLEVDVSELVKLAADIEATPAEIDRQGRTIVQEAAKRTRDTWRENARATAGAHGVHYPASITYQTTFVVGGPEAEIGPDPGKPQGGMGRGFEFGSINQPPHLDGQRALTTEAPGFERATAELAERVLR